MERSADKYLGVFAGLYIEADAKPQFSTANIPGKCFGSLSADKTQVLLQNANEVCNRLYR
jgi:hypothetical protein